MLTFTDKARDWIQQVIESQSDPGWRVRLGIAGRGPGGWMYDMGLMHLDEAKPDDIVVDNGVFLTHVDPASAKNLQGAVVDLVSSQGQTGLKIENPNPLWTDPVAIAVQQVLDEEVNPNVASHGGFVQLLDVKEGIAYVRLGGGCHGCGMAKVTLKQGVEVAIRKAVPQVKSVLDTTDHAQGANPYYQPAGGGASPFE